MCPRGQLDKLGHAHDRSKGYSLVRYNSCSRDWTEEATGKGGYCSFGVSHLKSMATLQITTSPGDAGKRHRASEHLGRNNIEVHVQDHMRGGVMLQKGSLVRITRRLTLVTVLTLFCAQTCMSESPKEEAGNPRAGQILFINKGCMRCHSIWGSAQKKGPSLASVGMGRNLYELCASIWSHWPQMNAAMEPIKKSPIVLSPSEIRDIIAYLYYLNYYTEPGDEANGQEIFLDRGCRQCHAIDPMTTEGKPGPPLYEMVDFQGPISLAAALWNHGEGMLQRMLQRDIPWPQFQDKEVADLVSYIRTRNEQVQPLQIELPGNPVRGRELFASRSCSICHESTGRGSRVGPNLAAIGVAVSVSSLVTSLWNHYPKMAQAMSAQQIPRTQMTTVDMEDLIAYVYWIRAYGLAGDPTAGQDLYQTKNCARCHSQFSGGVRSAPQLLGAETTRSPYPMLAAIWNHGPKMQSLLQERNIEWPTLTGDEMRHLIAFFRMSASRTNKPK